MICPECGMDNTEDSRQCARCGGPLTAGEGGNMDTNSGLPQNVAALLCYLLGWISGLAFILTEKENEFVRFHALQSIFAFGGFTWLTAMVFAIVVLLIEVPNVGVVAWFSWVVGFWLWAGLVAIVWILLMVMAYRGKRFKLIWFGDYAEKFL